MNRHAELRKLDNTTIGWETLFLALILIATFIPFLGENLFTTKGEPREAVVALSMLRQGNWILPVSFGTDIPYKPPFLAWCVAALGWLNGGTVTEMLSRLPSAVSAIVMLVAGFRLAAHRGSIFIAAAMTVITAGTFELFRTATVCRVDMLLIMFTVTSVYALYRQWWLHPSGTWLPSLAGILLMTGAVLTKGPIGMLIPCGIIFIFRLCRGNRFLPTLVSISLSGLMSLVIPAIWYWLAYRQGGDTFLQLAMEENFGRFTGSMSYSSHEHNAFYNVTSLLAGFAPYTLLAIIGLLAAPWRWKGSDTAPRNSFLSRLRTMDSLELLSWIASLLIFVFYCIPKSKRSVYLLPMYPFLGYLMARYIHLLIRHSPTLVKSYCWIICSVGTLAAITVMAVMWLPEGTIHLSPKNEPIITALHTEGTRLLPGALCVILLAGGVVLARIIVTRKARIAAASTGLFTLLIYIMIQGAVLPAAMNFKSDITEAKILRQRIPPGAVLYGYQAEPMSRFFTINFYLDDDIRVFDIDNPDSGYLIIPEHDVLNFLRDNSDRWQFTPVLTITKRGGESHCPTRLFRFARI